MDASTATAQDAWTVKEWTAAARIALSTFYTIPRELQPAHVKIGRRTIITEAPRDWLERMATRGGVTTSSQS